MGGRHDILGAGAGQVDAEGTRVLAQIGRAHSAEPAGRAGEVGISRDELTLVQPDDPGPDTCDVTGELVPRHERIAPGGIVAREQVHIRPTDPRRPDLDKDLPRPGCRHGRLRHDDPAGPVEHHLPHLRHTPER